MLWWDLAVIVGVVSESGEDFLSLNRKISATLLNVNNCSWWMLWRFKCSLWCVSLCSMSHNTCWSFEVDHLFSGLSVLWDQGAIAYPLFPNQKIAVIHWSESKSYNKPVVLLHSQDFRFSGQWSHYINSFYHSRLLTATLQPCSFPFNVQVMILVGSSGFFNLASMSVDGCYLYIIHYCM